MIAAMLAAYMSTLDTHLNWGASYLVNDLYQPFIRPKAEQKELVLVSRLSMVLLTIMALIVSTKLTGIIDAYKYLGVVLSGLGTVLILRWYWWRVTAWSEIAAVIGALVIGNTVEILLANPKDALGAAMLDSAGRPIDYFAYRAIITTFGTAFIWIAVSLLTCHEPTAKAIAFCKQVRPSGPGWRLVREREGIAKESGEFGRSTIGWFAAIAFIYSLLFAIGSTIFARWISLAVCLVIAAVSAWGLRWIVKQSIFGDSLGGPNDPGDPGDPGSPVGVPSGGPAPGRGPLTASAVKGS
jgi:SSS family solute:Na+ symporter